MGTHDTGTESGFIYGGCDLRTRRRPEAWSVLEDACHVRDVLLMERDAMSGPSGPSGPGDVGDVAVREATEGDIPRIVELFEYGSLIEGKEDPTDLAPYGAALLEIAQGPGAVLLAEVGGEIVGVCQLIVFRHLQTRGGLCAEVESVHVHPELRGRGVGGVLMRAAVQRARALGCYRVQLTSNNARPEAHRFYEALGFEPTHRGFKLNVTPPPAGEPPAGEGPGAADATRRR